MRDAIRLTPSLRERVWGRKHLAPWYPDSDRPIGEAWFLAPRELPLLVKLIFTSERLSVQVHPDDGEDGPRGKTEMWHILDAEPGAPAALGLRGTDYARASSRRHLDRGNRKPVELDAGQSRRDVLHSRPHRARD